MRLALVVHDFDPHIGHGRYTVELAKRFAPEHVVHVWANRFRIDAPPGVTYRPVPALRTTSLVSVLSFLVSSQRLLKRESYDIVHSQGLTCWSANVVTAHICNAARHCHDPDCRLRHRLFPLVVNPLERRFYRRQDERSHLISISQHVSQEIRSFYGWRGTGSVIYHGTDLVQFSPCQENERARLRRSWGIEPESWLWLFVGEARKGLSAVLAQLLNFPSARLLVVSRSRLESFKQEAGQAGVANRVHFHGPTEGTATAYQAADAFVFPSRYDAFGLVVAEAMACGLPVVVGRDIGAAEWIEHQRTGLLCDPSQADSLYQQLNWLHADPGRASKLGLAARARASEHSWNHCAAATLRVYEQVSARRISGIDPQSRAASLLSG